MTDLTILLKEGLANRMRVMASLTEFAQKNSVSINWEINNGLNCSFNDLFESINCFKFTNKYPNKIYNSVQNNKLKSLIINATNKIQGYDFVLFKNPRTRDLYFKDNFITDSIKKYNKVFLHTDSIIFKNTDFSIFKPVKTLQDKINLFSNNFHNVIGIHIRRTDNSQSISNSPIELFINKIEEEIKKDKSVQFFVCSDNIDIKKLLKYIFKDRILTYNSTLERDSKKGIQDALIEMYCLSKTKKIYGSFYSSYTETAAAIGNIKFEQLTIK